MGKIVFECAHTGCNARKGVKTKGVKGTIPGYTRVWFCPKHDSRRSDSDKNKAEKVASRKPRFRKRKMGEAERVAHDSTVRED